MTQALTEPRPHRRRFRSTRTPTRKDVGTALVLLVIESVVYVAGSIGHGLQIWAAADDRATIDAARLESIAWTQYLLIAALVLTALALLARARWTALLQLLTVATLAALLALSQHDYAQTHPRPAPTPSEGYVPCYSGGSNDCPGG
ncbi:DUF6234 family protein [Streptomyces longisporoflavus]|uniref:DUF6234 family protein n=1 Tax=Streptomyces longisporoflavus TaxID=28044 RepID=A0ABW7R5A6_9ACTN